MTRTSIALVALLLLSATISAAPPIETYGRLPGIELMRMSPSGDQYALITVVGESRMFAVMGADGTPRFAVNVSSKKVRDIRWVGEDHVLVTISSTFSAPMEFTQDYELFAVVVFRLSDKTATSIFEQDRDVARAVFGYYGSSQADGHLYGYFGGITYARSVGARYYFDQGYPDLYRVDLNSGEKTRIAKGSERHRGWVTGPDGTIMAHAEYQNSTGIWQLFAANDRDKLLFEKSSPLGRIDLVGPGRTSGTVLISDSDSDEESLVELSLAENKSTELCERQATKHTIEHPDTGYLLGCIGNATGRATLFDEGLQRRFDATGKAFPGYRMRLESFSRNFERLIVYTDGQDDSGTHWLVDIASGKANPIGEAYREIRAADVAPTQLVRYAASDGREIEAVLTLPRGREPRKLPLLVMPHGGPIGVSDEPGFDWWAQAYASVGYAVLQPNYRGSSGYGAEFRDAGFGEWGGKMLSDIADGVGALAAQGTIDPGRACVVGASYGGYAALAGVTLQNGLYRCAVAVAAPADMPSFFRWKRERFGLKSDATRYYRAVMGSRPESDAILAQISPARSAPRADAPILLIHGQDDTVVPIEQSRTMQAALKKAGKPVELLVMDGEDHWLSREETRITMLKAAVAFVRRHNPPD